MSAGGSSTSFNKRRFDSTYLNNISALKQYLEKGERPPCTFILFAGDAISPHMHNSKDFALHAWHTINAERRFIPSTRKRIPPLRPSSSFRVIGSMSIDTNPRSP